MVLDSGENLGIMYTREALDVARERGLDLVEINPKANPPVCKIMDFGRFKYDQKKKQREAKKKASVIELKEVKFRPRTEKHDYDHKLKRVRSFLEDNNKVKLTVRFRGREMAHQDIGRALLLRVATEVKELGTIIQEPSSEGRAMSMVLAPVKD